MKTRLSLVSNSSSSSFICRNRPISEIAVDMWKTMVSEWGCDFSKIKAKTILKNIKAVCKQEDVQTGKFGLCFPSYEDTYILVVDGECIIDTCNNVDWDDIDGLCPANEDTAYEKMKDKFFYHTQVNNIICKRDMGHLPTNSKIHLVCPKCVKKWGKQNPDKTYHDDYFYEDNKGNRYCSEHFTKLLEVKKNTTIKTP
jgi:uncharacterized Zn ribbon protein